ncbi:S41 family peptidase [Extibacter muris]|uniref:S41 family peptidase n=1 Tax=Extibacter muris TaxID=1796622 RepID=UPI001D07BC00|nr:S41 family peptidase [Extibacter muris]MCB6201833.1 S41 family peptidase [Extibacter muris]MCQ4663171.1 S41 family peptidase [Extibacter muris]MCQ4692552.1 S41 family peptidase [Extibacter muris]
MKKNKGFIKGALCGALAVLLVAGLVSCGNRLNKASAGKEEVVDTETEEKLEMLQQLIDGSYLGDVDEDALQSGIYKGYINGLADPYSVYYDKEETEQLLETTSGEYSGIGAVLSQNRETGIITILQVYDDSPAQKAGIKENDILYKVEGEEVTGVDLTEVVSNIKGEEGTEVKMTVLRGDANDEVEVTAVRGKVEAQTVKYEMKDGEVGYIRVSEFDSVTYDQYKAAIEDLEGQGMKGLIVDLRNNPGGNLATVCDMLDLMLPEGLIVYTEDKDGNRSEETSDEEHQFKLPMTVLVNGNSASASEIYAGAIQDYGLGEIIGTQTYGKGVVQQIFDLKDGTCVKLTIAEYFTPKGRNINGKGITPDVEAEYEADEANPEADNQLDKALEVIKGNM